MVHAKSGFSEGVGHLLPHDAPLGVVDVVHLVEDDPLDVADDVGALVQHAAQDLGGHDEAGRLRLDARVAGQQPHLGAGERCISQAASRTTVAGNSKGNER